APLASTSRGHPFRPKPCCAASHAETFNPGGTANDICHKPHRGEPPHRSCCNVFASATPPTAAPAPPTMPAIARFARPPPPPPPLPAAAPDATVDASAAVITVVCAIEIAAVWP